MPGEGRRFQKGVSPNPGGRPKGTATLRRYVAARTRSGRVLVDKCMAILSGDERGEVMTKEGPAEIGPSIKDKAWAIEHLTKVLRVPLTAEEPKAGDEQPEAPLTDEEKEALRMPGTVTPIRPKEET